MKAEFENVGILKESAAKKRPVIPTNVGPILKKVWTGYLQKIGKPAFNSQASIEIDAKQSNPKIDGIVASLYLSFVSLESDSKITVGEMILEYNENDRENTL